MRKAIENTMSAASCAARKGEEINDSVQDEHKIVFCPITEPGAIEHRIQTKLFLAFAKACAIEHRIQTKLLFAFTEPGAI